MGITTIIITAIAANRVSHERPKKQG